MSIARRPQEPTRGAHCLAHEDLLPGRAGSLYAREQRGFAASLVSALRQLADQKDYSAMAQWVEAFRNGHAMQYSFTADERRSMIGSLLALVAHSYHTGGNPPADIACLVDCVSDLTKPGGSVDVTLDARLLLDIVRERLFASTREPVGPAQVAGFTLRETVENRMPQLCRYFRVEDSHAIYDEIGRFCCTPG